MWLYSFAKETIFLVLNEVLLGIATTIPIFCENWSFIAITQILLTILNKLKHCSDISTIYSPRTIIKRNNLWLNVRCGEVLSISFLLYCYFDYSFQWFTSSTNFVCFFVFVSFLLCALGPFVLLVNLFHLFSLSLRLNSFLSLLPNKGNTQWSL